MDLTELIEAFFAAKQRTFASNTRRAYRYDLMACAQVLPTLPVREITVPGRYNGSGTHHAGAPQGCVAFVFQVGVPAGSSACRSHRQVGNHPHRRA
jgi:hypothetical protein